jgi:hypothetical protein
LLAALACGSMVAGAFVPWARVTAAVAGSDSPVLAVKGTQIGVHLGFVPWGLIVLAAGAVGAISLFGDATLAIAAGFAGAAAAGANALLLGHDGQLLLPAVVADLVEPHVTLAWGSFFAIATSLLLLVTAATLRNRRAIAETRP